MSAAVAIELTMLERRTQVVDLAKTGKSYRKIASELGISSTSVVARDIAAWAAETRPSSEATEELRKLQREEILALREKLWAKLGTDEHFQAVDRLIRLQERESKLMGLDLERGVQVNVFTAESMASVLGYDQADVIEGVAVVELEAGQEPAG